MLKSMNLSRRAWIAVTACVVVGGAVAAFLLPRGSALAAIGDITSLLLLSVAVAVMVGRARSNEGPARLFWGFMAAGSVLWWANLALWVYWEVLMRHSVPDPFFGDVVLFVHVIPFMAAVALRPHRAQPEKKLFLSTLNFLMLLLWWIFLYAFIVFPDQYVVVHRALYSRNYDVLYRVENFLLIVALGFLAWRTSGGWGRIYRQLFVFAGLYSLTSIVITTAFAKGRYYSGSLYDVPFMASICWLVLAGLTAREEGRIRPSELPKDHRWLALAPRFAMIAMLSLPVIAGWAAFFDPSPVEVRRFRLFITLLTSLVLGLFVFAKQYFLDHERVRLLRDSQRSLEELQRLQTELVHREKLASLGNLVAGAAHEINNPLTAVLGYSDLLANQHGLQREQVAMAQKIGQQARRARDLMAGLLSFAQRAPSVKAMVDLAAVLNRALQTESLPLVGNVRVETNIEPGLPRIWGNPDQLFQCCLHIIRNALDALEEVRGGKLCIQASRDGDEVVLEFCDSGPGILEPQRVFDPFYTTKPIGKGTGLGLSSTYGVVQDHQGRINCYNRPEGGAVFVLRFPVTAEVESAQA